MRLDTSEWKTFVLGDLFVVKKEKRLTAEQQIDGSTPYIGAIDSNNGVANHIGQAPVHEGNTISMSYNGSIAEAFYQPDHFGPQMTLTSYIYGPNMGCSIRAQHCLSALCCAKRSIGIPMGESGQRREWRTLKFACLLPLTANPTGSGWRTISGRSTPSPSPQPTGGYHHIRLVLNLGATSKSVSFSM